MVFDCLWVVVVVFEVVVDVFEVVVDCRSFHVLVTMILVQSMRSMRREPESNDKFKGVRSCTEFAGCALYVTTCSIPTLNPHRNA